MKPFYLGIDVSKGYADFMIINSKKQPVVQAFQLDDTFEGHQKLYKALGSFLAKHGDAVLFAGMESTGGYENNWYHSLSRDGSYFESDRSLGVGLTVLMRVLNCIDHTYRFKDPESIRWNTLSSTGRTIYLDYFFRFSRR